MDRIKQVFFALVLLAAASILCACTRAAQLEDQAYILVMGLDRTQNGIEMCVSIPKISGGGQQGSSGSDDENYMNLSIKANDFEDALEKMDWASPRSVNYSQLKLIVISKELAQLEQMRALIESIAQTERLYTATKVAVCEGSAVEFVEAIKPFIGIRISTDIEAMFDHYNDRGYLPESSLADLFYQTVSVYSDPMTACAILDKKAPEESNVKAASALSGSVEQVSGEYQSDIPTRYLGAALFKDGIMRGNLNGEQTVIVNLLRNELDSFRYSCDGQSLEFVPARNTFIKVDTSTEPVKITLNLRLSFSAQERIPDENILRSSLKDDILKTIDAARELGCEPFGFAERAARKFLTLESWIDYNWKDRYKTADIDVIINFAQSDT